MSVSTGASRDIVSVVRRASVVFGGLGERARLQSPEQGPKRNIRWSSLGRDDVESRGGRGHRSWEPHPRASLRGVRAESHEGEASRGRFSSKHSESVIRAGCLAVARGRRSHPGVGELVLTPG